MEHQRSNDDEHRAAAQANALRLDGFFPFLLRRDDGQPTKAQQSRPPGDSAESPHGDKLVLAPRAAFTKGAPASKSEAPRSDCGYFQTAHELSHPWVPLGLTHGIIREPYDRERE